MTAPPAEKTRNLAAWWLLGLLNNAGERRERLAAVGRLASCHCCCPVAPALTASCHLGWPCSPPFAAYVIMLAGANEVSAAAVGLVYLCAVGPSMLCKARSVAALAVHPQSSVQQSLPAAGKGCPPLQLAAGGCPLAALQVAPTSRLAQRLPPPLPPCGCCTPDPQRAVLVPPCAVHDPNACGGAAHGGQLHHRSD